MKTINISTLEIISGGLDNPIYTNTLYCSNSFPGSMVYGQDESKAYYLFFRGISGPEGVAYHMTTDLVFDRAAYVEVIAGPLQNETLARSGSAYSDSAVQIASKKSSVI